MKLQLDNRYEIFEFDKTAATTEAFTKLKQDLVKFKVQINIHGIGVPDVEYTGAYCIHQEDDAWLVYFSERGRRSRLAVFADPFDAADYFLWKHTSNM